MKKNYCFVAPPPGAWQKAFKALFLLWAGILLLSSISFAQPVNTPALKGNVTDETGQPISGVSVNLKGTALNTQTNDKGDYSLNTSATSGSLVFSYVGKKTEEVAFEGNTIINVMLLGDVKSLEEYVAIGYGVAKKKDLTGSVSNIDGAELANRNATQISQALQGTMPGVMVTRTNTLPGASASILVRGVTTIGNSAPLVIVDGVPVNSLDDVNADDVQDISVLKDAVY